MSANELQKVFNSPAENVFIVAHPELKEVSSGFLVCEINNSKGFLNSTENCGRRPHWSHNANVVEIKGHILAPPVS